MLNLPSFRSVFHRAGAVCDRTARSCLPGPCDSLDLEASRKNAPVIVDDVQR